jgi:transposase-like protein
MEDYPRTLLELERRLSTDTACRQYLFALRWPGGFVCPRCNAAKAWPTGRGLWMCGGCHYQVSVTAGTVFQDTRLPLTRWFGTMWYLTSRKNGVSAMSVHRILGLGSCQTAWAWLHKLRRAMVRPGRDRLQGFIAQMVEPGSKVVSDGLAAYQGMVGYSHQVIVLGKRKKQASELLGRVHRVVSLLKRWLLGTHQAAIGHGHLDYYLDEFTFRFNRRTSTSRGKLFYRLVQQAVQVEPHPYHSLIRPQPIASLE